MGESAGDIDFEQLSPGSELLEHALADDVDGDAARDFARAVAAHAIGKHRQA